MAASMMAMPCLGNNATPLDDNATPLGARLATRTPCLGDNTNLGDNKMPLGARSVMKLPSSEMHNNNTKLELRRRWRQGQNRQRR